jgi:hypothetical protein
MRATIPVLLRVTSFACLLLHSLEVTAAFIPPNLPPGSQYQLIFVTQHTTAATNNDIAYYNTFVTAEAALNPLLPQNVAWHAVASTATVNTIDNAPWSAVPVYNTAGIEVASVATGLYGTVSLLSAPEYNQFGTRTTLDIIWTGSHYNGTGYNPHSLGDGSGSARVGQAHTRFFPWIDNDLSSATLLHPMYALSSPITVPAPEPSTRTLLVAALLMLGGCGFFKPMLAPLPSGEPG